MELSFPTGARPASAAQDASDASDARDALRRATSHLHAQVDAEMPLAQPAPTLADYREHVELLLAWTDAMRALPGLSLNRDRFDAQADVLRADLAVGLPTTDTAGVPGQAPSDSEPSGPVGRESDDAAAFGWGVAYVVEGSHLGGQVLYRQLATALAPHPLAYLQGAGRGTGARWTAFLADLRGHLTTPGQVRAACDGAGAAFTLLLRLRTAAREGRA